MKQQLRGCSAGGPVCRPFRRALLPGPAAPTGSIERESPEPERKALKVASYSSSALSGQTYRRSKNYYFLKYILRDSCIVPSRNSMSCIL